MGLVILSDHAVTVLGDGTGGEYHNGEAAGGILRGVANYAWAILTLQTVLIYGSLVPTGSTVS
jgi:hypothetical protein